MSREQEQVYFEQLPNYFNSACGSTLDKLNNFSKFVPRQALATFLYKYELYQHILSLHGSIVECGVHYGGGAFTFAQLSSILEPYNYQRKIIAFDTYEGFPEVTEEDFTTEQGREVAKVGAFKVEGGIDDDLVKCRELYDLNRPLGHVNKVEFIKGDVGITAPAYIEQNPQLIISLLYLDMDIYKPTVAALKALYDRVMKGGIIAFDEINNEQWPGETQALHEVLGIGNHQIRKFPFEPCRSYIIKE